ncbi:rhodanese-like domain-containing protein [Pseudomonadota bacterium AL_CKDN230030165-1A_HGKHYDSX7]
MDLMQFLLDQNNIFILAVAVVSGVMLCLPGLRKGRGGAHAVDIAQATQLVNKSQAVWIDVRAAEQYQAGHIAQARSLPAQDLESKAGNLPKNKPLILVCEQGRAAPRIAQRLRSQGFADVYTLEGGMRAWYAANLPVTQK